MCEPHDQFNEITSYKLCMPYVWGGDMSVEMHMPENSAIAHQHFKIRCTLTS